MSKRKVGICKLTGKKGEFVKSHIIPKAFTYPSQKGNYFLQSVEENRKPIKRWSSWYDDHLVIREGEDILSELDDFAVKELSKYYLVWRSWNGNKNLSDISLTGDIEREDAYNGVGWRLITSIDQNKLRLFCLSILWRAAASDLPEMSEVVLPKEDLEAIRKLLINQDAGDFFFYPIMLLQLSTLGPIHNLAPIKMVVDEHKHESYRFYFDGLIMHFYLNFKPESLPSDGSVFIGHSKKY